MLSYRERETSRYKQYQSNEVVGFFLNLICKRKKDWENQKQMCQSTTIDRSSFSNISIESMELVLIC